MNRTLLFCFLLVILNSCSKSNQGPPKNTNEGEKYTVEIDNPGLSSGWLSYQSSLEPLTTITLKPSSKHSISLYANVGDYVKLSLFLPAAGDIRVLDSKNVQIDNTPVVWSSSHSTSEVYFLAYAANVAVKDPFKFKKGIAKVAADELRDNTFINQRHYYLENGNELDIPNLQNCVQDDQYIIKPSGFVSLNLNPNLFVASVEVTAGADHCGGWSQSAYQSSIKTSIFSDTSKTILFPVYDPASIEFPYGYGHVQLQFDSISPINKTLTLHRMVNTKKEVFIFKRIN